VCACCRAQALCCRAVTGGATQPQPGPPVGSWLRARVCHAITSCSLQVAAARQVRLACSGGRSDSSACVCVGGLQLLPIQLLLFFSSGARGWRQGCRAFSAGKAGRQGRGFRALFPSVAPHCMRRRRWLSVQTVRMHMRSRAALETLELHRLLFRRSVPQRAWDELTSSRSAALCSNFCSFCLLAAPLPRVSSTT
jgi:hypothetical protein